MAMAEMTADPNREVKSISLPNISTMADRRPICNGDTLVEATSEGKLQSGASYLSQDFVIFFHVSCEGLPGPSQVPQDEVRIQNTAWKAPKKYFAIKC